MNIGRTRVADARRSSARVTEAHAARGSGISRHVGAYLAIVWSLLYAVLGFAWTMGGGYPFGPVNDPEAGLSVLGGVPEDVGAPAIAILSFAAAAAALAMLRGAGRGAGRLLLLAFGVTVSVVLTVVIPDYRVLVVVAYAPILLLGAPFGWPPGVSLVDEFTWPLVHQLLSIAGGIVWAGATLGYRRRTAGGCDVCGRADGESGWTSPEAASRWRRWAIAVAVVIPLVYSLSRWAWALGIPLGVSEEFLRSGDSNGMWLAGAMLASLAAVGAGLTVGLGRPWGERLPEWLPMVGGGTVPPALAIVPASFVAVIVTAAGLMFVRLIISGTSPFAPEDWGALLPEVLWPVWGVSLGAAAYAYHLRRRAPGRVCGRGAAPATSRSRDPGPPAGSR